ncbi:MAG: hypothetical protein KKB37_04850 [Alphaproteobacteria bacterium]|nr:hypothetical protein [Alphaproteobacteria bacterium]
MGIVHLRDHRAAENDDDCDNQAVELGGDFQVVHEGPHQMYLSFPFCHSRQGCGPFSAPAQNSQKGRFFRRPWLSFSMRPSISARGSPDGSRAHAFIRIHSIRRPA